MGVDVAVSSNVVRNGSNRSCSQGITPFASAPYVYFGIPTGVSPSA